MISIVNNKVRFYREKLGISTYKLAELANISQSHVVAIENGKRVPTIYVAKRLANALETTVDELFPENQEDSWKV